MILADTSVWIDHFRKAEPELQALLHAGAVVGHPFIIGELSLGDLRRREQVIADLKELPCTNLPSDLEVLSFIESEGLHGKGVGFIDVHLLASVLLTPGVRLWTRDKRLLGLARKLGVAADFAGRSG